MADTSSAAAIEPVVATQGGDGKNPAQPNAKAAAKQQPDNALDRVFAELGIGEDGADVAPMPSIGEITRKVEAREQKTQDSSRSKQPAAHEPPPAQEETEQTEPSPEEGQEPKPTKFKTYKVGGKDYQLTDEQADRFAQKGIHYEKQGVELVKMQRQLQGELSQIAQERQQHQSLLQALAERPGEVLEAFHGKQAFKKIEPWAGEQVVREMEYEKNPHQRVIDEANARAQAAEERAQSFEQQERQRTTDHQTGQLAQQYQQTIVKALEQSGIPKTDFTARDMVVEMKRAIAAGVEHTPERLAEIVKSDNTERARALTEVISAQIEQARQANDSNAVVRLGAQLVDTFGEPVVYAIAKYHLAKLRNAQPNQPKQVIETQRVKPDPKTGWGKNGRQYMSEDDYADMRRKIARGEMEPPAGW